VTLITFNDTPRLLIEGQQKQELNTWEFDSMECSGGTALYDAMQLALTGCVRLHEHIDKSTRLTVTTTVVVMTQGGDTSSRATLSDIVSMLERINRFRNFKILLMGANLSDTGRAAMLRMAIVGDSDIMFKDLGAGDGAFNDVFEHVGLVRR